jgi:hypothetical protein
MSDSILHIRCGDDLRQSIPAAGLGGDYLKWCDPLCDGPTPEEVPNDDWYGFRARWIADRYGEILAAALGDLMAQDEGLYGAGRYDKIVIWSEHDLFDQAILARLLAHFADRPHPGLHLIDSPRHLGPLGPSELENLWQTARPVSDLQMRIGKAVWEAWRLPIPLPLADLADTGLAGLPHMAAAIRRHLANLPGSRDGLSLTERLALQVIADGAELPGRIFARVTRLESAAWMGDSMFYPVLEELGRGPFPLLEKKNGGWHLTALGGAVVMGQTDATRFIGRERWVGGVFLTADAEWRWDENRQRPVQA